MPEKIIIDDRSVQTVREIRREVIKVGAPGPQGPPGNPFSEIVVELHGGFTTIEAGQQVDLPCTFPFEILSWFAVADRTGSITVDVWRGTFDTFPPTNADSITGGSPIAILNDMKAQSSSLTDWDTKISSGDILRFNVDSADEIQRVSIVIRVRRTQ